MNEQLLLALFVRSGLEAYVREEHYGDQIKVRKGFEKFAELIVQECMNVCATMKLIGPHKELQAATLEDAATEIKDHFGVKE